MTEVQLSMSWEWNGIAAGDLTKTVRLPFLPPVGAWFHLTGDGGGDFAPRKVEAVHWIEGQGYELHLGTYQSKSDNRADVQAWLRGVGWKPYGDE